MEVLWWLINSRDEIELHDEFLAKNKTKNFSLQLEGKLTLHA
jgi:hypothetical protein